MPEPNDRVRGKLEPGKAEQLEDEEPDSSDWRNLIGFWILGLCNNYGYSVMLSAAHDILAQHDPNKHDSSGNHDNVNITDLNKRDCNYVSTGAILLADVIPLLLIKIIAPFLPLCVHVRMFLIITLSCVGYILVGASEIQTVAIIGVIATSFATGLGEATLLSYAAFFKNKNVVSTWSSGTGGAGFFGSLSYATLTGLGLSPSTTIYVLLVVPTLMAVTFWAVLEKPKLEAPSMETGGSNFNSTLSNDQVPLALSNDSFGEKLRSIPPLFKYMIPVGLVFLFEYFINQGLGFNVIFFTSESLYSFLPNIYVVLAAVAWEGLLGGAAYVNTFYKINREIALEKREFSMGITSLADALGTTVAGFLAMPVHNYICGLPRNL